MVLAVLDTSGAAADRSVTLADTAVGQISPSQTFTLTNSGNQTLVVTNFAKGGANAADFAVVVKDDQGNTVSGSRLDIASGEAYTVVVTLVPTAIGIKSASVTFNTNDPDNPAITLTMSGAAGAAGTVLTRDNRPTLSGTVDDPNARITVTIGTATATADNYGDGTWTLAEGVIAALPDGTYCVGVTATSHGGAQTALDGVLLVVDTTAPVVTVNAINQSTIQTANIASLTAGVVKGSTILATTLKALKVNLGYENTNVTAATIGSAALCNVDVDNGGVGFGLDATTLGSLKLKQGATSLTWLKPGSKSNASGFTGGIEDFFVKLV